MSENSSGEENKSKTETNSVSTDNGKPKDESQARNYAREKLNFKIKLLHRTNITKQTEAAWPFGIEAF